MCVYEAFEVCDPWDNSKVSPVHGSGTRVFSFHKFHRSVLVRRDVSQCEFYEATSSGRSRCALSLIGCFICFGLSVLFVFRLFVSYCKTDMAADLLIMILCLSPHLFRISKRASCNFIIHVLTINIYCSVKNGTRVMRNVKWSHNLLKKNKKQTNLYAFRFYTDLTHLKFSSDHIVYICQCIIYEFIVNHLTFLKKTWFFRGMAWLYARTFIFNVKKKNLFFIVWLSVHSCNSQFQYPTNKNVLGNFDFPWNKIYEVCLFRCWLWLNIPMLLFWHNT